jgi:alpha-2-macroglobulin
MRRRMLFMILLLTSVIAVGIPQLIAQGNRVAFLQILESEPFPSQPLALDEAVTFYFDRRVDCGTAQAAFSVQPFIDGSFSCDEYSLTFTPTSEYERNTQYTFQLTPTIVALDETPLLDAYSVTYTSVGFLEVVEVFPSAIGGYVPADSDITVIFDRPVIPLLMSTEMDELPNPLEISPAVEGTGEWINTSMYIFTPDEPLQGGVSYIVSVSDTLEAVDGSKLETAYIWTFITSPPEITSIDPPPDTTDLILDPKIQVRFSQPMDEATVESAFYVRLAIGADTPNFTGTFEWADDSDGFMFTPDDQLALSSVYNVGLEGDVSSKTGSTDLQGQKSWEYSTVPYPAIIGTDPVDGSQGVSRGGFSLYFASPMNIDTLEDKITIDPVPDVDPYFYYSDWSYRYSVSFGAQASTIYTITIAPGMEDIYGNPIQVGETFTYTTEARPPALGMQIPGAVGFYNAYRDPTQMYIYHRGVDYVDLELYNVPIEQFVLSLTNDEYYDPTEAFIPNPALLESQWRINSDTPENITRYELLALGDTGGRGEVVCPGAPSSRVRVGDNGIVLTEPDALRARSEPAIGEVVELLYRDYAIPIVGGPECIDGIVWWQVQLRDESLAWVGEGIPDEYFIGIRDVAQQTEVIIADDTNGQLVPGVYLLDIDSPQIDEYNYAQTEHFLNVSTAVLTVKQTIDSMTVWATDVDSGKPIFGETITIYDERANIIATGVTDVQGIAKMDIPYTRDLYTDFVAVLSSDNHFGVGYSGWTNGLEPYQFGQSYSSYPKAYETYLYTDRPVYRTDQPVYFRGIVRSKNDVTYTRPPFDTVPVTVTDDRGEIVYEKDLPLTAFGTFSDSFNIAPDGSLGAYRVSFELPSDHEYRREGGSVSFLVAEYRLPEYQVEMRSSEPEIVQGDSVEVELEGSYFFGGKVSNADVDYTVLSTPFNFRYEGEGYYDFRDYNYDDGGYDYYGSYGSFVTEGLTTTDGTGIASIDVVGDLQDSKQSQTFRIEAGLQDEASQKIFSSTSFVVHKGLIYVGARAENYVSTANEESTFNIIAVDWDSNPVPNQTVDVEVVERRWSSIQEQDPNSGDTVWTWEVEELPVTIGVVTTDAEGKAQFTYVPPNGGTFKIIVSSRDEVGTEVRASSFSWVSSREYVSWRQDNDESVDLVPEQTEYSVGDTAKVLITSPYQGTSEALISIERGDIITVEHITMESNSHIYEFEILPEYAPNVYVSVFIVKAVDETNPIASYRMGITRLLVDIDQKELNIDITADREMASPQETVQYLVKVTDYKGDPVVAEVGVGVTDLAALSLRPRNSEFLLETFYSPQSLSVRTSNSLVFNADEVTAELAEAKGGGGGIFDAGILNLRGEFIDTPYWNPTAVTNENGEAILDVRLPDNLTTWRLDARALTDGSDGVMLLGEDTFDLLSTRPLIIRPVTPRFFIVDDKVLLSAVVNNNTEQELSARVSIENMQGLVPTDGTELVQEITIPSQGRARVSWEVIVQDVESVAPFFVVRSDNDEYTDASVSPVGLDFDGTLPVYRYEVPETVGTSGALREGGVRVEAILMPRDFEVRSGELDIKIDKSLAGVTNDSLTYLEKDTRRYRECTTTIIDRFLPNVITFHALSELGLAQPELQANLDEVIPEGMQELYARQRADGGWGWCSRHSSHSITTAHALIGLSEAQKQGYAVDQAVINRAQEYLGFQMITPSLSVSQWELNRQAFLLYALAYSGKPDIARSVTLFDSIERMNLDAIAYLAKTLVIINPNDNQRLDVLAQFMINNAVVRATGIFFEESYNDRYNWSTNIRTTSLILNALIQIRPESELLPNIVRHLVSTRTGTHWRSRQENTWSIIALTNWMMATNELNPDYSFNVAVNENPKLSDIAVPANVLEQVQLIVDVSELIQNETNLIEVSRTEGDGVMYYTAHLTLDLPVPEVEAFSRGVEISRTYSVVGDEAETPIDTAVVGETIQVRLRIVAPNTLRYVVIEDAFPAGAEAIDPNLSGSETIGTRPQGENIDPRRNGWGWWYFDNVEFRDEKAVIYASYLPKGVYEYVYTIRPGVEGTYNVIPPVVQEVYFPEVYGRGDGMAFTITR